VRATASLFDRASGVVKQRWAILERQIAADQHCAAGANPELAVNIRSGRGPIGRVAISGVCARFLWR
jgi:hypothetical protein